MSSIDTKQSLLAEARVTYAREQQQQTAITGKIANSNPTEADLLASDSTLQAAITAAENSDTSATVTVGGGQQAPSGGASSPATKPDVQKADIQAAAAPTGSVDVTA